MANRLKVLDTLEEYFNKKGRILKQREYMQQTDAPVRVLQIRKIFGVWNKMEKLLMVRARRPRDESTDVYEVIKVYNQELEAERLARQVSTEEVKPEEVKPEEVKPEEVKKPAEPDKVKKA